MINKNKGITLIALVVTIIILIILATVSINMVVGENGLIRKAEQARDAYEESSKREEEDMGQIIDEMEILLADGEAQTVTDEKPGELSGDGSKEKPYLIESIEDLVKFSEKVNGGETFEEKVVKLKVNLDFSNDISYVDSTRKDYGNINGINETEELKVELTTGTGFKPIGTDSNNFNGTFDGGGHTIKNIYISATDNYVGLFGMTGEKSNIKNIEILKANIKSTGSYVGGLIGKSKGTVEKVTIREGKIEGNEQIGGVVGQAEKSTIVSCTNTGSITGGRYIGGIAGYIENNSTIESCSNNGVIVGNGILYSTDNQYHSLVGGIAGSVNNNSKIINSSNHNIVKSTRGINIGGIVGEVVNNSTISKCYNEGKIGILEKNIYEMNVGGICGALRLTSTVSQCFNKGEINGESAVGGIVGYMGYNSTALIENCYNTGSITGMTGITGGIGVVAGNTTKSEIKNSYNTGIVSVTEETANNIRRNRRNW